MCDYYSKSHNIANGRVLFFFNIKTDSMPLTNAIKYTADMYKQIGDLYNEQV